MLHELHRNRVTCVVCIRELSGPVRKLLANFFLLRHVKDVFGINETYGVTLHDHSVSMSWIWTECTVDQQIRGRADSPCVSPRATAGPEPSSSILTWVARSPQFAAFFRVGHLETPSLCSQVYELLVPASRQKMVYAHERHRVQRPELRTNTHAATPISTCASHWMLVGERAHPFRQCQFGEPWKTVSLTFVQCFTIVNKIPMSDVKKKHTTATQADTHVGLWRLGKPLLALLAAWPFFFIPPSVALA